GPGLDLGLGPGRLSGPAAAAGCRAPSAGLAPVAGRLVSRRLAPVPGRHAPRRLAAVEVPEPELSALEVPEPGVPEPGVPEPGVRPPGWRARGGPAPERVAEARVKAEPAEAPLMRAEAAPPRPARDGYQQLAPRLRPPPGRAPRQPLLSGPRSSPFQIR